MTLGSDHSPDPLRSRVGGVPFGTASLITAEAARPAAIRFSTVTRLDHDPGSIVSAIAYATAHGVYEMTINGELVTDTVLNPGWTSYQWRLQYQRFDVTDLVRDGGTELAIDARVGNGWYRGDLGYLQARANYGDEIGVIIRVEIAYSDGTAQDIVTTPEWTATTCEITSNSLYDGERIDARLRTAPGDVLDASPLPFDAARLVPQSKPPLRRQEAIRPQSVTVSPTGKTLIDFGQNLVGWILLRVSGDAGSEIIIRHAEVIEHGELGSRPLRFADATDTFVLSGDDDIFEPTFTFHGFRYIEVTGWPRPIDLESIGDGSIEAVVVHSDIMPTSEFESSSPLLNQLVHNTIFSQKGNFFDVPIDCPQRDERLGWTGDIAAYAATAAFQFDSADFLHSWLIDLALETSHHPHGTVPNIVPDVTAFGSWADQGGMAVLPPQAIWGDAAVWVPEALWRAYGDRDRLAAHYPGMVMHLQSVLPRLSAQGLWDQDWQYGDWLDPDAPPDAPWEAKADRGVVATACLFRSLSFAAEAASVLGHERAKDRWTGLAARTRSAFVAVYVTDPSRERSGRIHSDCATVYALAIHFGLLSAQQLGWAGDRLAHLARESGYRVSTGFAGTPYVTWALSETGHVDEAYALVLQTECPSWLYPVTMGATTTWERWDSVLPNGTINPGEMTSMNHNALGAVADWIYQVVAGIRPESPGYETITIEPRPGPGVDWVNAAYESRSGRIESRWSRGGEQFDLEVRIPDGADAEVILPDGQKARVGGGAHHFRCAVAGG